MYPSLEGKNRICRNLLPDSIHRRAETDVPKRVNTQKESNLLVFTLINNGNPIPGVVVESNPGRYRECVTKFRNIFSFTPDAGGVTIEFKGLPFYTWHTAPGALKMISAPGKRISQGFV